MTTTLVKVLTVAIAFGALANLGAQTAWPRAVGAAMVVAAMAVAANISVEVAVNTLVDMFVVAVLTSAEGGLLTPERISGEARALAYRTPR